MQTMRILKLVLTVGLSLGLVACERQSSTAEPPPSMASPPMASPPVFAASSPSPRYQIVFGPHARADTFLLDTYKGRVWRLVKYTDLPDQPTAFDEVEIIDNRGEIGMRWSEFRKLYSGQEVAPQKQRKASEPVLFEQAPRAPAASQSNGGR